MALPAPPGVPHDCIYLDWNATTPLLPEVVAEMSAALHSQWGNPSSAHAFGAPAAAAVALARGRVARLLGAQPEAVFFCSCGTEANAWALHSAAEDYRARFPGRTPHVVTSCVEHPAVLAPLAAAAKAGQLTFTAVGVGRDGVVSVGDVEAALTADTCLLSLMHANNETGALQPVAACAAAAAARGVPTHSDCAQSCGKVPVSVAALGAAYVTVVAHKFGGPKGARLAARHMHALILASLRPLLGCAALVLGPPPAGRRDQLAPLHPLLRGGGQERGARAGTEAVLAVAGLGAAAHVAASEVAAYGRHTEALRSALLARLAALCPGGVVVHGPAEAHLRLPNTLSLAFPSPAGLGPVSGAALVAALARTVAVSAGAACHSSPAGGGGAPSSSSSVLASMAVPPHLAAATLRLSLGRHSTEDEVERAAAAIARAVERQQRGAAGG